MPSDELKRIAAQILQQGTADMSPGFLTWWTVNEIHYKGRPSLKSLDLEWDNYTDDPGRLPATDNGQKLTPLQIKVRALEAQNNVMD